MIYSKIFFTLPQSLGYISNWIVETVKLASVGGTRRCRIGLAVVKMIVRENTDAVLVDFQRTVFEDAGM